jgi:hypothetical protein
LYKLGWIYGLVVEVLLAWFLEARINNINCLDLLLTIIWGDKDFSRDKERNDPAKEDDNYDKCDVFLLHGYFTTFEPILRALAGW